MSSVSKQVKHHYATICPLVINNTDAILTFQTASTVATNKNVNSKFSSCNPTDYDYLDVYSSAQVHKCCTPIVQKQVSLVHPNTIVSNQVPNNIYA